MSDDERDAAVGQPHRVAVKWQAPALQVVIPSEVEESLINGI